MLKFTNAALAVALLGFAVRTFARSATPSAARSALGDRLYDAQGTMVGSVYAFADGGRTAVIEYGTVRTPGRRLVAVPATEIIIIGG